MGVVRMSDCADHCAYEQISSSVNELDDCQTCFVRHQPRYIFPKQTCPGQVRGVTCGREQRIFRIVQPGFIAGSCVTVHQLKQIRVHPWDYHGRGQTRQ